MLQRSLVSALLLIHLSQGLTYHFAINPFLPQLLSQQAATPRVKGHAVFHPVSGKGQIIHQLCPPQPAQNLALVRLGVLHFGHVLTLMELPVNSGEDVVVGQLRVCQTSNIDRPSRQGPNCKAVVLGLIADDLVANQHSGRNNDIAGIAPS